MSLSAPSASMLDVYGQAIGLERDALTTPALVLDLPAVRQNIALMAARTANGAGLRPHAKSHKSAEIARLQIEAGAIGVTTATAWEAVALAQAGIDEILVANEVVGNEKIRCLVKAAQNSRITVAVDNMRNVEALSMATCEAGSKLGILIDIDIGLGRCGARTEAEALQLARHVEHVPGLQLRGVMGYEGHCALEPNRAVRSQKVQEAMERLLSVADTIKRAGLPVEIVSAGGTGTYDLTGNISGVTELQAGSYVLMDAARREMLPDFAIGLTVLASVVSRHQTTLVLDCGKKTIGIDFALPRIMGWEASAQYVAEEHAIFAVDVDCPLDVGDRVELMVGYCPTTINLHDVYHVVENGRVIAIWPVLARGPGRFVTR